MHERIDIAGELLFRRERNPDGNGIAVRGLNLLAVRSTERNINCNGIPQNCIFAKRILCRLYRFILRDVSRPHHRALGENALGSLRIHMNAGFRIGAVVNQY
ncbi:MAG: hypothetical protein J6P20_09595, partial [Oscillospiraceae bacterium]|nr:hypothetical protein [Oscillospiraceae bacterium]